MKCWLQSVSFLSGRGTGASSPEPEGGGPAWCSDVQAACGTSPVTFQKATNCLVDVATVEAS